MARWSWRRPSRLLKVRECVWTGRANVRDTSQVGTDHAFDSLGKPTVGVDVVSSHDHIVAGEPAIHGGRFVDLASVLDETGTTGTE